MKLTKGEFVQFSLAGRLELVEELGEFLGEYSADDLQIRIFRLYDFFVEVRFRQPGHELIHAEPVLNLVSIMHLLKKNK